MWRKFLTELQKSNVGETTSRIAYIAKVRRGTAHRNDNSPGENLDLKEFTRSVTLKFSNSDEPAQPSSTKLNVEDCFKPQIARAVRTMSIGKATAKDETFVEAFNLSHAWNGSM